MFSGLCLKKGVALSLVIVLVSLSKGMPAYAMGGDNEDNKFLSSKKMELANEWRNGLNNFQEEPKAIEAYNRLIDFYNKKDFLKAVEYGTFAVEGEHPEAKEALTHALYHLSQNYMYTGELSEAVEYLERAQANNPPPYLQTNILIDLKKIGMKYYTTEKFSEAYEVLIQVAGTPHPLPDTTIHVAQFTIARMYYEGKGVSQSTPEALKWFNKANENDHPEAQEKIDRILAANLLLK